MKRLFNFYLDDNLKNAATEKLEKINGSKCKGQFAALLRAMIKFYVELPEDDPRCKALTDLANCEYIETNLGNRSTM